MTTFLSDGFEDGTLNAWVPNSATAQSSVKHTGTYAAALTTSNGRLSKTVSALSFVHERIYFKLSALPQNGESWIPLVFTKTSNDQWAVQLSFAKSSGGVNFWSIWSDINGGVYAESNGGEVPAVDDWHCLDLVMNLASSGYIKAWLDGNPIINATHDLSGVTIGKVQCLSWNTYASSPTLYVDDVVIDDTEPSQPFAEDFENGLTSWTQSGSITVEEAPTYPVYDGTHSCRTGVITGGTNSRCVKPIENTSELYMRSYVYFENLPQATSDYVGVGPRFSNSQTAIAFVVVNGANPDKWGIRRGTNSYWQSTASAIQTGRWYCVEMYLKLDDPNGILKLWIDGVQVVEQTNITGSTPVNEVSENLYITATEQQSLVVFHDCLVVSDSYVGPESEHELTAAPKLIIKPDYYGGNYIDLKAKIDPSPEWLHLEITEGITLPYDFPALSPTELVQGMWGFQDGIWKTNGFPSNGASGKIRFIDTEISSMRADLFAIDCGAPLLATNEGMVIQKDLAVGGFLSSNQGALWLGSGLDTQVDVPKIVLLHGDLSILDESEGVFVDRPAVPKGESGSVIPSSQNYDFDYFLFVDPTHDNGYSANNRLYKLDGTYWTDATREEHWQLFWSTNANAILGEDADTVFWSDYDKDRQVWKWTKFKPASELSGSFNTLHIVWYEKVLGQTVERFGNIKLNTLYADNLKKVNGDPWDLSSITGIQKGSSSTDGTGFATVTFGSEFSSIPEIVCTPIDASGRSISIVITDRSTTGFSVKATVVGGHSHSGSTISDGSHSHTVNSHSHAITVGNHSHPIGNHTHPIQGGTSNSSHGHGLTINDGVDSYTDPENGHTHNITASTSSQTTTSTNGHTHNYTVTNYPSVTSGSGSSHRHYLDIVVANETSHTHTVDFTSGGSSGNTGEETSNGSTSDSSPGTNSAGHNHTISTSSVSPVSNISINFSWIAI